jgi:hypothetical protein
MSEKHPSATSPQYKQMREESKQARVSQNNLNPQPVSLPTKAPQLEAVSWSELRRNQGAIPAPQRAFEAWLDESKTAAELAHQRETAPTHGALMRRPHTWCVAVEYSGHKGGASWVTLRARWVMLRARWVTLRARWVTLRARWVTLRARWVTLRARWVTLRARWVMLRARWVTLRARWVTLRARWVTLRARWVTLRARWVTLRARWVTFRRRRLRVVDRRGSSTRRPRARG